MTRGTVCACAGSTCSEILPPTAASAHIRRVKHTDNDAPGIATLPPHIPHPSSTIILGTAREVLYMLSEEGTFLSSVAEVALAVSPNPPKSGYWFSSGVSALARAVVNLTAERRNNHFLLAQLPLISMHNDPFYTPHLMRSMTRRCPPTRSAPLGTRRTPPDDMTTRARQSTTQTSFRRGVVAIVGGTLLQYSQNRSVALAWCCSPPHTFVNAFR